MSNHLILPCETGEISDGYHTFNELYEHRCLLFIAWMSLAKSISWVSQRHSDGSSIDGWFIAGMNLPTKTVENLKTTAYHSITYHLPVKHWQLCKNLGINELAKAPEWDGHTSGDVINRINEFLSDRCVCQ